MHRSLLSTTFFRLSISVGALYIRKYFSEESRSAAIDMVNNIREEYNEILTKIDWMANDTRETAIKKAKAITNHIGYPNELADVSKLEEFYKELEIEADNLMLDKLRLTVFVTNFYFGKLRETVNKTEWTTHAKPAQVNAFYAGLENSIRKPDRRSAWISLCTHRNLTDFFQSSLPLFCKTSSSRLIARIT